MRGLGVRGRRLWSLGGALRGFLRLDLMAQLIRGPGVQGSRWWYLSGALRSFLRLGFLFSVSVVDFNILS